MRKSVLVVLILLLVAVPASFACSKDGAVKAQFTQTEIQKIVHKLQNKGWVGIELDKTDAGHVVVARVVDESPAAAAGLRTGDVLLAMNGMPMSKDKWKQLPEEKQKKFKKMKKSLKAGDEIVYLVKRDGAKEKVRIILGTPPESVIAQWLGDHLMREAKVEAIAKK